MIIIDLASDQISWRYVRIPAEPPRPTEVPIPPEAVVGKVHAVVVELTLFRDGKVLRYQLMDDVPDDVVGTYWCVNTGEVETVLYRE